MGDQPKRMKAKSIHKNEYEKDWLLSNYVPDVGEVVFYKPEITEDGEPDYTVLPEGRTEPIIYTRQKNGDGINKVKDLPFSSNIQNLSDDFGEGSLAQIGSEARGGFSAAFGKNTKAYQIASFATGGETQAGLSYDEWLGTQEGANLVPLDESDSNYIIDYVNGTFALPALQEGEYPALMIVCNTIPLPIGEYSWDVWCVDDDEITKTLDAGGTFKIENKNTRYTIRANSYLPLDGHVFKIMCWKGSIIPTIDDFVPFDPKRAEYNTAVSFAFASGYQTIASGLYSHAEGRLTQALDKDAHAEGNSTIAKKYAHAEGAGTKAFGNYSHAEGNQSEAHGETAHSEGQQSVASGLVSHAEGYKTTASGTYSHSEGNTTTASGEDSHAEGYRTTSSGLASHTEGFSTNATNAYTHAEGAGTTASGTQAHAEGQNSKAEGQTSHAEGQQTVASGHTCHAEGYKAVASGETAHAEGQNTVASGKGSHAGGLWTIASKEAQTAIGKYNKVNSKALLIVGNGTSDDDRSNAFEVLEDGTATLGNKPLQPVYDVSFSCREYSTEENDFKNEGYIYIKASTTHGLSVLVNGMQTSEEYASYFRLYCTDYTHQFGEGHSVFIEQSYGQNRYPTKTWGHFEEIGTECYWYIPVSWDENYHDVPPSVYIKGINYDASSVECGFIKELPSSDNIIDTNPIRLDMYNYNMEAINNKIGDIETALRILNEGA